jgi:hypothetical protein
MINFISLSTLTLSLSRRVLKTPRPRAERHREPPWWVSPYAVWVNRQSGVPDKEDAIGASSCSISAQGGRLSSILARSFVSTPYPNAQFSSLARVSPADVAETGVEEKRGRSISTPASRVFNKPPLNSLGLCDESVAECLVGFKLVTI